MKKRYLTMVLLLIFVMSNVPNAYTASNESSSGQLARLPIDHDQTVGFVTYDLSGEPTESQPKLRGGDNFKIKWRVNIELPTNLVIGSNENAYVVGVDRVLRSFDIQGKERWNKKLDTNWLTYLAFGKDGTLYAVSGGDPLNDGQWKGEIYAFSELGKLKWSAIFTNQMSYYECSFTGDKEGNFIIGTRDGITSFNRSGKINWVKKGIVKLDNLKYIFGNNIRAIRCDWRDNIYISTDDDEIISLDNKGNQRWKALLPMGEYDFTVTVDGNLYFDDGSATAMVDGRTGKTFGAKDMLKKRVKTPARPSRWSRGTYVKNDKGESGITAKDNFGNVKWRYNSDIDVVGEIEAIRADASGNVFFDDYSGNIYSLDKNGNERFILIRKNSYVTGTEFFVSEQGDLICSSDGMGLCCVGKI